MTFENRVRELAGLSAWKREDFAGVESADGNRDVVARSG